MITVRVTGVRTAKVFDTVLVFSGEDVASGKTVTFGVDHRMAQPITDALTRGDDEILCELEGWQILGSV